MKFLVIIPLFSILFSLSAIAESTHIDNFKNKPYSAVRADLISEGWQTVNNKQIESTSLYAQSIFNQGFEEVLDCISMERDQCQFLLKKDKQLIIVTTKETTLNVESISAKK
jgi:hypothetical protein